MSAQYDMVIRGGTVVDGTGAAPFVADIAVKGGLIVAIGAVEGAGVEEIQAAGLTVTPGFVDVHTHYDGQITWENTLAPSSDHGVTTVVMGNCGVGFAPVRKGDEQLMIKLMEGVEDIPEVVMAEGVQEMLPALDAPPQTVRGARNAGVQDMHPLNGATDAPRVHEVRSKGASGAPGTVLEPSLTSSTKKSSSERKRGTRIPDDFKVTPEMHAWAKEHVPELGGLRETEKFINYWRAKSGASATKLDWPATWRNWMLTAAERLAPRSGHKPYTNPTDPDAYSKGL